MTPGSALLRKAFADVTRRKTRSLGVILGIMIGVFGLTAITMFQDTYFAALAYTNAEVKQADITFDVQAVDPAFAPQLQAIPNVQTVEFHTIAQTSWHIQRTPGRIFLVIVGLPNPGHIDINAFQLLSGHSPGPGEIVLESGDRGIQSFALGDTITVDTPQGSTQLRVVGIAHTRGAGDPATKGSALGYMSQQGLAQLMEIREPNVIQIRVHDTTQAQITQAQVRDLLQAHHVAIVDSTLHADSVSSNQLLANLFTLLRLLSIVAIVVSCFLVINTITTLLAGQTHIIGTMKAIGGTQRAIFLSYLLSVGLYTIVGTLLGLCCGIAGGYALAGKLVSIHNLDLNAFTLPSDVLALGLAAGLLTPILAALLPLWNGTRITVREAISAYGVSSIETPAHSRMRQSITKRLTWIPQTTWLGLRSVFRKRGRAILTILALTLSGTTFLAIANATYAINTQVAKRYENYHFDVKINQVAGTPEDETHFQNWMLTIPNVRHIERSGTVQITTQWGNVDLSGVDEDTRAYHPSLVAGRWFLPHERQVLLVSDDIAHQAGLHVGEAITFSAQEHPATWKIIGIIHDPNVSLGSSGSAVTTSENLNALIGLPQETGVQWYLQASDSTPAAIDALARRLDRALNRGGGSLQFVVTLVQQVIQSSQNEFSDLYMMFYVVALVVALVGALSLYTTLISSVLERQREIGIWRSMGASGRRVAGVFWIEGLALGMLAWAAGLLCSIPLAYGFLQLLGLLLIHAPFTFDPWLFATMLLAILAIALLASLSPMVRAARVRIVDLLHYE
ncbi:MAG: ABC transporter permease [Chloroflexota bacterium]|nr:ABC transporter permease [Chloroflexota bacterium]